MSEPFGLPEIVAVALACRIVLSVAWIRYGRPANQALYGGGPPQK